MGLVVAVENLGFLFGEFGEDVCHGFLFCLVFGDYKFFDLRVPYRSVGLCEKCLRS